MGPPHGQAEKTQVFTYFGNHGFGVITETWIHGVPLADCFYVEDCLLVKEDPNGGISISIMFDITFVQRTMFRNIISITAINDVTKFFKEYIQIIQRRVQQPDMEYADDRAHSFAPDLVMYDEGNSHDSFDNEIVEEARVRVSTTARKSDLFQSVMKTISQTFVAISNILEIKPLVWVLLLGLVLNQCYLTAQIKWFQEKIAILESVVINTNAR